MENEIRELKAKRAAVDKEVLLMQNLTIAYMEVALTLTKKREEL